VKRTKKCIWIVLVAFFISFVGGCVGMDIYTNNAFADANRMQLIEYAGQDLYIYKDTATGVHYLVYSKKMGYGASGGICVLVDVDGKPLI